MLDFSNIRLICKQKNEYFKAFATKICDVAPLALQMLLSCLSSVFVTLEDTCGDVILSLQYLFLKLYVSVIYNEVSSSFRFF